MAHHLFLPKVPFSQHSIILTIGLIYRASGRFAVKFIAFGLVDAKFPDRISLPTMCLVYLPKVQWMNSRTSQGETKKNR